MLDDLAILADFENYVNHKLTNSTVKWTDLLKPK